MGINMPSSLLIADLHEAYHEASMEDAITMANLGATCWNVCKTGLYEHWLSSVKGDETAKADAYRAEGRQAMLDSVKARLAVAENLHEQLQISEAAREEERIRADQRLQYETGRLKKELADMQEKTLQIIESEVSQRLADVIRKTEDRKDQESISLRLRIASLSEESQTVAMMETTRMKRISALEAELTSQMELAEEAKRVYEKEFGQRLEEAKKYQLLVLENQKSAEISELRQKLAELNSLRDLLAMKEEARSLLSEKVAVLEEISEKKQRLIDVLQIENTKSSYAIGKEGESLIFNIITEYVLPVFLYSSAKDMTGVSHAADIHVYLQSPLGKRMKILIDAKKYKDHVRLKEVTKLHADVDDDGEAMAGIMISTSSQISSVKQFQIEKTPKGKYVLYLSVEGFSDELRGKAICWAIRVLSTLVSYSGDSDDNIIGKIAEFFKELDLSMKEADQVMKACQKSLDLSTVMKKNLGKRLDDFRVEHLGAIHMGPVPEIPVPIAKAPRTRGQSKTTAEMITHVGEETVTIVENIPVKKKGSRNRKKKSDIETPAVLVTVPI